MLLIYVYFISTYTYRYKVDCSSTRLTALVFHLDEWVTKRARHGQAVHPPENG